MARRRRGAARLGGGPRGVTRCNQSSRCLLPSVTALAPRGEDSGIVQRATNICRQLFALIPKNSCFSFLTLCTGGCCFHALFRCPCSAPPLTCRYNRQHCTTQPHSPPPAPQRRRRVERTRARRRGVTRSVGVTFTAVARTSVATVDTEHGASRSFLAGVPMYWIHPV